MLILLFGPPGCGKGTQAAYLAARFRIPAISTGEVFRAECKSGTELGRMASAIMASGGLVGDDIVNGMVGNRLARPDCARGCLLDGYPRTIPQARFLADLADERGMPEPVVIHMDVPADLLVARLTARRQCPDAAAFITCSPSRPACRASATTTAPPSKPAMTTRSASSAAASRPITN